MYYLADDKLFHDGNVVGIHVYDNGNRAEITIDCLDITRRIILDGLSKIRVDNFNGGNIVLYIDLLKYPEIPRCDLEWLFNPNVENICQTVDPQLLNRVEEKLIERDLTMFILVPSFGCEIRALCKSIKYINIE